MAKSKEAIFSEKIIKTLNKEESNYFLKLSDSFIVGLPDIYGSFNGRCCVFEAKVTKRIINGKPLLSDHKFSPKQIQNLKYFDDTNALAIGLVGCTDKCVLIYPKDIQENGQIILDKYEVIEIRNIESHIMSLFKGK